MNLAKLQQMAAEVRIGGKGSVRRKKKYKRVKQNTEQLNEFVNDTHRQELSGIDNVTIEKSNGSEIYFANPRVIHSCETNMYVVKGLGEPRSNVYYNRQLQMYGASAFMPRSFQLWNSITEMTSKPKNVVGKDGASENEVETSEDDDTVVGNQSLNKTDVTANADDENFDADALDNGDGNQIIELLNTIEEMFDLIND